jgi:hypothetical protein
MCRRAHTRAARFACERDCQRSVHLCVGTSGSPIIPCLGGWYVSASASSFGQGISHKRDVCAIGWPTAWDSMVGGGGPEQAGLYSALAQIEMEELGVTGGLLGALLDCATEGLDAVVTLPRRKLCALALCKVRVHLHMQST